MFVEEERDAAEEVPEDEDRHRLRVQQADGLRSLRRHRVALSASGGDAGGVGRGHRRRRRRTAGRVSSLTHDGRGGHRRCGVTSRRSYRGCALR